MCVLTHTHVQHGEQQLLTAGRVLPQRTQQRGMGGAQGGGEGPGVATNGSLKGGAVGCGAGVTKYVSRQDDGRQKTD